MLHPRLTRLSSPKWKSEQPEEKREVMFQLYVQDAYPVTELRDFFRRDNHRNKRFEIRTEL